MAVVIRLQRCGRNKSPSYRVVAADKRMARDGRFLEVLGFHNPIARGEAPELKLDLVKIAKWIKNGALPSPTVSTLIDKAKNPNKPKKPAKPKKPKEQKAA